MLLKRLALRNFRVYEDYLELELPSGLIGIYGSNGSGKSTLLEAILFALWGKARTAKEDVRTAGVGADCVAELTFEHEGHLYEVRRSLSGINLTARAEVLCDGLAIAEGVRDAGRYLHQVLGMDDVAFRASVFAEQKQLAAFSERTAGQRRELVLQLLGITPLDAARDAARKDAREVRASHDRLREMLPDLDQLRVRAADTAAAADATKVVAEGESAVAAWTLAAAEAAAEAFARHDRLRQEYDGLVIEGRAARDQLDTESHALDRLLGEQENLEAAASRLAEVLPAASGLDETQRRVDLVTSVVRAEADLAVVVVTAEPARPDLEAGRDAEDTLAKAQGAAANAAGQAEALKAELARAEGQAARSATLSSGAECPLCGQELGDAFEKVQAHRTAEVHDAATRLAEAVVARDEAVAALAAAQKAWEDQRSETDQRAKARATWERAAERRAAAQESLVRAREPLGNVDPWTWVTDLLDSQAGTPSSMLTASIAGVPQEPPLQPLLDALRGDLATRRAAADELGRLRGRLDRRAEVDEQIEHVRQRVADAEHRVEVLREKVRLLAFDRQALQATQDAAAKTRAEALRAQQRATEAGLTASRALATSDAAAELLANAEKQHASLVTLADESRHLGRLAELMNAFRNTIVATVGPRLAVQAAELFAELTDNEYDYLKADPDTYELQICDGGRLFGLDRFSGSEVDLANLALRVAVSEHVRFQSGGTVGLLVLDEVFGPLDQDRKARMLQALERLRGRFRQIVVVTHDNEIKEQLPNAIEVVKRPGRRATARLLAV